jgi:hypothetical protein
MTAVEVSNPNARGVWMKELSITRESLVKAMEAMNKNSLKKGDTVDGAM